MTPERHTYDSGMPPSAHKVSNERLEEFRRIYNEAYGEEITKAEAAEMAHMPRSGLLPSEPCIFGSEDELVSEIQAFIHRYVDLSPTFEKVATHYVLLTWFHDAFNELPYLRLHGDFGSGKTRALLTIGSLCYKAFFASGASTVSPIFHTLNAFRGTLILDEADFRFSDAKADIVKILNNGNVRGMPRAFFHRLLPADERPNP